MALAPVRPSFLVEAPQAVFESLTLLPSRPLGVSIPALDRRRLERLWRYVGRPPLANERLEERPDGRLALRLKTRWRDGTTHVLMERRELIDRRVPLIPR